MRSVTLGAIFALLITGRVYATQVARTLNISKGEEFTITVTTLGHDVITCHLTTPSRHDISFTPGDSKASTDKIQIQAGQSISLCEITVKNADENDVGEWILTYDASGDVTSRIQTYLVTVEGVDHVIEPEIAVDDREIIILAAINHLTRTGQYIDVTLSKVSYEEECYWITPERKTENDSAEDEDEIEGDDEMVYSNNEEIQESSELKEGVIVHESSNFVSCRIVIGPMSESLLGNWSLCGRSLDNNKRRCQPVNIAWNNNRIPGSNWDTLAHPAFEHVVHFGGSVNPAVGGIGEVRTCHVITPNNEDLVLTTDVQYPYVERVSLNNPSVCSVVIKDIDATTFNNWTIYGKFQSVLGGLNEVRLPISMVLYNEDNPYEQAYNVTLLPEINRVINLGTNLTMEVTGLEVKSCQFTTPSGQTIDLDSSPRYEGVSFANEEERTACRINVGPITKNMLGEWELIGKFRDGNMFNERVQTFRIIQEDPENPIEDIDRRVEMINTQNFNTTMGATHRVTISAGAFTVGESCHLRTPNGRQYTIMDGFNISGVEVIEGSGLECGVLINLVNEDLIGEWVLIARSTRLSEAIERRLPFTIYVEERVNAIPAVVNMAVGTDLYVRLEVPTDLYKTCKLLGPANSAISYEIDNAYESACGYIVKTVHSDHNGDWEIAYGNKIVYRAFIHVNVFVSTPVLIENQSWTLGRPVHTVIGPEDAVYCRLRDPNGITVFEDFGRCTIELEKTTMEHHGVWRMSVALPGTVVPQDIAFVVDIDEAGLNPIVSTSVVRVAPSVMLTCSVPAQYQVQGCKFRDHRSNIMIAHHDVGQEGFATSTGFESESTNSSCTLRLTNPTSSDLGLWRCAVDTDQGTHYAFLTVTCPWLMQFPEVSEAVVLEPSIAQERTNISSLVGDSTTMSCSIAAPIRYCYFRARNGTIFNVRPGASSQGYEYIGSGFDSGECGVRFENLLASDSGRWSCHIGLLYSNDTEHVGQFDVNVQEKMTTLHYPDSHNGLVLVGNVTDQQPIKYCRFVRIDGLGFTSENIPEGYTMRTEMMEQGTCMLYMHEATMLNLHPWTIVAKLRGIDGEIVGTTPGNLLPFPSSPTPDEPGRSNIPLISLWVSIALLALGLLLLAVALIPPRHRRWTQARASELRNSFKKKPLPADFIIPPTQNITPQSA